MTNLVDMDFGVSNCSAELIEINTTACVSVDVEEQRLRT